jgi:hypothetical protein
MYNMGRKKLNIELGLKINRLTYIKELEPNVQPSGNIKRIILCKCVCGVETKVKLYSFLNGKTKSCSCYRNEFNKTHNESRIYKNKSGSSTEYTTWCSMKQRCYNPNNDRYYCYGGRGIKICDIWLKSFETFLKDMGRRPGKGYSIDRINVNGDYEPSNCRWATATEQQQNKRK